MTGGRCAGFSGEGLPPALGPRGLGTPPSPGAPPQNPDVAACGRLLLWGALPPVPPFDAAGRGRALFRGAFFQAPRAPQDQRRPSGRPLWNPGQQGGGPPCTLAIRSAYGLGLRFWTRGRARCRVLPAGGGDAPPARESNGCAVSAGRGNSKPAETSADRVFCRPSQRASRGFDGFCQRRPRWWMEVKRGFHESPKRLADGAGAREAPHSPGNAIPSRGCGK